MNSTSSLRLSPLGAIATLLLASLLTGLVGNITKATGRSPDLKSAVIKPAPAAPKFDQQARHRELAARRSRVAQSVGPNGILFLFSGEPRVYAGDVNYHFRQENNLYYLTNLKQKGATLVLTPGNDALPEILFLPRRIPIRETWTGHMYSVEEAGQISGIREIWEASEFEPFARALRNRQPYVPKPENVLLSSAGSNTVGNADTQASSFQKLFAAASAGQARLYLLMGQQEQLFAGEWASTVPSNPSPALAASPAALPSSSPSQSASVRTAPPGQPVATPSGYMIENASRIFADLRLRKSPMEIALMQHAIDITTEAIERSWVAAAEAKWEYEIDAVVLYTFKLRNADHWGYPPIVGCGPNATTLHYEESQGPVGPNDLFLMDVGAEYEHYSADVTRTFPVSGKFTPAHAEIYQIVYDAQEAGAKAARPGKFVSDVDRAATEVIKDGLLKLGLITDRNSNQYRLWFMHGTSHWLGMNVHDVGFFGTKLEPGMVFTNEPGIYVRNDALDFMPNGWVAEDWEKFKAAVRPAFERHKNTGVRIEDDLLVTATGVEWMTRALPRKISDIEDFIARARREAR
jgi:Xaa-Pro aminopeptidase